MAAMESQVDQMIVNAQDSAVSGKADESPLKCNECHTIHMSTMEVPRPDTETSQPPRYTLSQTLDNIKAHKIILDAKDDAGAITMAELYKSKRWLVENGKYELSRDNITIHTIEVGAYSDHHT